MTDVVTKGYEHLTEEEISLMRKNASRREEVVDSLMKEGVPTNTRNLELLLQALGQNDEITVKHARLRMSGKQNDNVNEANASLAAALLKNMSNDDTALIANDNKSMGQLPPPPPADFGEDVDIVEGELDDLSIDTVMPKDLNK